MASAVVGALRVLLGLDTANFDKGIKETRSKLGALGTAFKSFAVGFAGALSAGGIAAAFKSIINQADNLGKTAQRIGIPVEELSKLSHAAQLADVSLEQLGTGVSRLSRNMLEVAQGAGQQASMAFRTLGINVKNADGTLKSSSQVLTEIAGKFSQMPDGATKTALAMQLLGRAGAQLIPLLNAGSAGLQDMFKEAEQLGIVITSNTARAAEEFNDNLTRLGAAIRGVLIQMVGAGGLAEVLADVTRVMADFARESGAAVSVGKAFSEFLRGILQDVMRFNSGIRQAMILLETFKNVINAIGTGRQLTIISDGWARFTAETDKLNASLSALNNSVNRRGGILGATTAPTASPLEPVIEDLRAADKAAKDAAASFEKLKSEGQKVWDETRTPLETYQLEIRNLNDLMQAGVIDTDTYGRAIKTLQDEFTGMAELTKDIATTLENSFMSAFDKIIDGSFSAKEALASLMKDLARLLVQQALFGGAGGGIFGNLFGGGRASGGNVNSNKGYIVGERGPEWFQPRTNGQIIPNGAMGGVNVQIINNSSAQVTETTGPDGDPRFLIEDIGARMLLDPRSRWNRILHTRGSGPPQRTR